MCLTRTEAETCAESIPDGFVDSEKKTGIAVVAIIEILYYAFEAWKACAPASVSPSAFLTGNCFDGAYTNQVLRRAAATVRRGARRVSVSLDSADIQRLAEAGLDHVRNSSQEIVAACLAVPCPLVTFAIDIQ